MPAPAGRGAALLRALRQSGEIGDEVPVPPPVLQVEVVDASRPVSPDQFVDARAFGRGSSSSSSSAPSSDEASVKLTKKALEEPKIPKVLRPYPMLPRVFLSRFMLVLNVIFA